MLIRAFDDGTFPMEHAIIRIGNRQWVDGKSASRDTSELKTTRKCVAQSNHIVSDMTSHIEFVSKQQFVKFVSDTHS